jgi:hypothetical protein
MVQAEILLSLTLAVVGAFLLIGAVRESTRRESARRGQGPGGVPVALPATPALPATLVPAPWTAPGRPIRRPGNKPAPALPNGVRNSRFTRYDRSGRPAAMGSPYLRADGPAPR